MKEVETVASEPLGAIATLKQIVLVLGFQDLTSFFVTTAFVIIALAFAFSCAVFLIKKRRERLLELNKIVMEVQQQSGASQEPKDEAGPLATDIVEKIDLAEKEVAPLAPSADIPSEPVPAVKKAKRAKKKKLIAKEVSEEPAEGEQTAILPAEPELIKVRQEADDQGLRALGAALSSTRGGFIAKLARFFSRGKEISNEDFEELEAILFTADIGAKTAQKLLDILRERVAKENNADKSFLRAVLKEEICRILESAQAVNGHDRSSPQVMMFVGVNGAGKTTSIGKLGAKLSDSGKKVLFGAGDTFRAAATLQLSVWADRVGAELVFGK